MITLENYEGYLFLYHEGELDSQTRAEVERFLLQHPEIREEMEAYYDPTFVVTAEKPKAKKRGAWGVARWAAAACVAGALVGYGLYAVLPMGKKGPEQLAAADPIRWEMPQQSPAAPTAAAEADAPAATRRTATPMRRAAALPSQPVEEVAAAAEVTVDVGPTPPTLTEEARKAEEELMPTRWTEECECVAEVREAVEVDGLAMEIPTGVGQWGKALSMRADSRRENLRTRGTQCVTRLLGRDQCESDQLAYVEPMP